MNSRLLVFFIAFLYHIGLRAGNNEVPAIEFFSYKDGLTTSAVYNVYKDLKGFIWVCTENGLFRYDGYNFKNLNSLISSQLNSGVLCVSEDENQNLWIGTSGNGIFILKNETNELIHLNLGFDKSVNVSQILILNEKIWIATSSGLVVLNKNKNYNQDEKLNFTLLIPSAKNYSSQDKVINCLYYMGGGNIWVGTNSKLFAYNFNTGNFSEIASNGQNSIRYLSQKGPCLIAGSWDGGIFMVDTVTLVKTSDSFIDYANRIIGDQRVKSVFADGNRKLYVATYGKGLFVFKNENNEFSFKNFKNDKNKSENIKSNIINQMYSDRTGILWLCMNQPALVKIYYQDDNFSIHSPENKNDEISEIASVHQSYDKSKLWVASSGNGIYLFDINAKKYFNYTAGNTSPVKLINDYVSMCFQDSRGNLWIVYRRHGLYVIPSNKINALLKGDNKSIVPLDGNALLAFNPGFNSYISKFYEDSKGRIWVGMWGALFIIKPGKLFDQALSTSDLVSGTIIECVYNGEFKTDITLPFYPVTSVQEVRKGEFWVGTVGGGVISITEKDEMQFTGKILDLNRNLPQLNIRCILRDKNDGIWIGTNGGLVYFNYTENRFRIITKSDGLPSDDINNIVQGKNDNVWVSTFYGAAEFSSRDFSFKNYLSGKKDELNQFIMNSAASDAEGILWLATTDALVSIKPHAKSESAGKIPLYITDIKIDNYSIKPFEKIYGTTIVKSGIYECEKITVPYNHTLSIEFAELNYKNTGQVLYKYKLGNSKEWIRLSSNQRNIAFSNMKSGEYPLEIMSANTENVENIKKLVISIKPPFWRSKTAFFIYFFVILSSFLIYRRSTIQKVLQKNEIEKERYERKKLEELDKMKSEFFSNISHEFRTPLSLIINPLEKLTTEDSLSAKIKEKIDLVLKSSNRLLKLTNELMDFSKIEKNSLVPYFQLTEMISFIRDIFHLFENVADSNQIEYRFNNSIDQLPMYVDRNMTEKVIFNLLSNAFKYTPKNGTILLDINEDKEFLRISVINTGEGIDPENIDKVFDRYFQVNNVQNRNTEGTGIGLSLVKNYVELQSGMVEVVSNPGTDTAFNVFLPLKQKSIIKDETTELKSVFTIEDNEEQKHGFRDLQLKSQYHILVAEDEEDLRNFIVSELEPGFKVTTAVNGEEGIKLANELIPDLIITDVMMPVIDGIEFCNTIKNQMSTSHIPIIILSARTKVSEQIEGLEMGADVYMLKPFNMEHLKVQIVRLVKFKEKLYSRYLKENSIIPEGSFITKLDEEFMNRISDFLEKNLSDTNLGVEQLAGCVFLSKVQTYRKVKAITGLSVVEFIRNFRLKKAARLILDRKMSFSEVAFETGFSSPSYFTRCFHEHYGKTPSEYASESLK